MARWVRTFGAAVLMMAMLPVSAGQASADSSSGIPVQGPASPTESASTELPAQDQAAQVPAPDVLPSDLTNVVPGTVSGDWGLEVANSASAAEVQFGDPLSYTLTVSALGTLAQTAVVVRNGIPRGTTYASGSAACDSSGPCMESTANDEVTWELGLMSPGATRTVTFRVTVDTPRATIETGIPAVRIRNTGLAFSTQVLPTPSNEVVTEVVAVAGVKTGPRSSGGPDGSGGASEGSMNPDAVSVPDPVSVLPTSHELLANTGAGPPLGAVALLGGLLLLAGIALVRVDR